MLAEPLPKDEGAGLLAPKALPNVGILFPNPLSLLLLLNVVFPNVVLLAPKTGVALGVV